MSEEMKEAPKPEEVTAKAPEAPQQAASAPAKAEEPKAPAAAPAEAPKAEAAAPAAAPTAEAKEAPKKEKPSSCAGCKKSIKKKRWYYRDGKYYCTKRCWITATKKSEKKEAAPAA